MSDFPPMEYKAEPQAQFELPPDGTSLTLLQVVYRSAALPLPTRMRAAAIAIPFEHPKLAVTAVIGSDDLAERLDRAIARANGTAPTQKVIEAQPVAAPTGPRPTPLGAPFPHERRRA